MSWNTYFIQGCSTCGRKLQVRIVDLGKNLICQHCGGEFVGEDHENESAADSDPIQHWIQLADEVLLTEAANRPK